MTRRRWVLATLAVFACAPRRSALPPRPAQCATETVPGLETRAVAWSRGRWVAAIPEGRRLALRAFDDRGEPEGSSFEILGGPLRPDGVALVVTERGVLVAAALGSLPAQVRVLALEGESLRESQEEGARTEGTLALVARPAVGASPAALFTEEGGATVLRLVSDDGSLGTPRPCPPGISPRSITAWDDGFIAARVRDGISLARLDASCVLRTETSLGAEAPSTHAPALAADAAGTVVTWTDGESRAWLGGIDHAGALRIRPTALEIGTEHVGLTLPEADHGRAEVRVIALRRNEVQTRLQLYRFDPRGVLRDVGGITVAPEMVATTVAPDPWGGALVGWSRLEGAGGGIGRRPSLAFFSRVCP